MQYLIAIVVLAAVITIWGYCYSKWGHARGGCGMCSALKGRDGGGCCQDGDRAPDSDEPRW